MSEKIYWDTRDFVRGELKKILKKRRECDTLARMEIFGSPTFVLFVVLFAGLAFGNLSIKGISFGSSGVLFAALVAGHFGLHVPDGIADVGTAIFVYCVGLGVGNRFFDSLKSRGKYLIILSLLVVSVAWLAAWVLGSMLGMDAGTVAGLFAGACTSTPALAAAIESQGSQASAVNIGYAVAYPFGVVGVVLFVQLLPRFLRQNLDDNSGKSFEVEDKHTIISRVVQVTNPELIGRPIGSFCAEKNLHCRITRIARDGALMPLQRDDSFTENGEVLLVGERDDLEREIPCFGHVRSTKGRPRIYTDERAELIVLSRAICNKSLRELDTLGQYGIVISRITRLGLTFIPTADTEVQRNDVLRVVGSPEAIESFRRECGHRSTALNAADILSLVGGLMLGVLLGKMQFSFGGGSFSLGTAGGPLVVALILGHFGKLGPFVGYIPRPTRVLLMELGLVLFLAGAGVKGGAALVETLRANGLSMFLVGCAVTLVPMVVSYVVARSVLRMSLSETLGGICGSMTSTPALGAITAKTDCQEPVIAYSTAYPAALILMTVLAKLLCDLI